MGKKLSRRDFLMATGLTAAATVSAGLLGGCSPKSTKEKVTQENTATVDSSGQLSCNDTGKEGYWSEAGEWIPRWLVAPEYPSSYEEELNCDVLVVGLGVAGLCASRSALENGATVVAIEQSESYNCRAAQFGNVNSSYQTSSNVEFSDQTKADMLNAAMKANAYRPNPKIWKYFLDNSGSAFDWHVSAKPDITFLNPNQTPAESGVDGSKVPKSGMGATSTDGKMYMTCFNNPQNPEYNQSTELYPMWPTVICFRPDQTMLNDSIMKIIQSNSNATVRFNTACQMFITDNSGAVVGAYAKDNDGKVIKINAKAVVDACGDYASNTEMRSYFNHETFGYTSWVWPNTTSDGTATNMGMGLKMAVWAGGKPDYMPAAMTHSFGGALGCDPFLLVNKNGERFCNEDVPGHLWSQRALRCPNKQMFQIFDDNYPNQVHTMPTGHANYWKIVDSDEEEPWGNYIENIGMRTRDEVSSAATCVCNTLDELASNLDIPADTLKTTISRYNELANSGFDADFGKRSDRLYPIEQPPFYGSKLDGAFAFCMVSGVMCDEGAHVLSGDDLHKIPGLYVCGNTMGSRFAGDYPTTLMGCSHGMAMTYGRLAGVNAAKGI
jgi:succinate dehydrogenase/fumarate reductase flavoprotein subunit